MEVKTGGQTAARALIEQGVEVIFTLCGGHLNPIYVNLEKTDVEFFDTRHEQSAVWMAEAYGRLKRKPGVVMVTAGPGFTNTITPMASAWMASTPLVLISGCVGTNMIEKLDLQDIRQAPVIEPMVKKALICHKPERIPEFIDLAFREAVSGRPGPVYLELPIDVLNGSWTEGTEIKFPQTRVPSRAVDREKARELVDLLLQAEKPIVVAGSGAWYSDAGRVLSEFAEKTKVPIFSQANGRGVVPDSHPLCFGGISGIRPGAGIHGSFGNDLTIILGTRLNLFTMFGEVFNPAAKMVQVDIEAEEIGRNRQIDLPIMSDIQAFVSELNAVVDERGISDELKNRFSAWIAELEEADKKGKDKAREQWESDSVPIHPMRLAKEVDAYLDSKDDILATDGGDTTTWIGMTRTFHRAGHYLDYGIFGSLGGGLPYAIASKYLYPEKRVLLLTGDGSMGFNFMEYERAITKNIPIVTVISNDLGWGMIRHSQELRLGHAITGVTDLGRIEYHKIVEAMGGFGILVEKPDEIKPAIDQAFASGKPSCVNVMTDPTAVSPGSVALSRVGAYK
ncbi:MAG: thiamine pyrophosphate-binding protein [Proteobacteria bacterium]|nr:thiamine pyrophosphate-binding protein [Pseudomonadota bacterium]